MSSPSIVIVHPDRRILRIIQRVLGGTGYAIDIASDLDHANRLLIERTPLLIVLDGSAVTSPAMPAFVDHARDRGAESCITLIGDEQIAQATPILELGAITNLLVHPMPVLAEELTITAQKLLRNDVFGLEKYLLWGTELHTMGMTRSSQRPALVTELADHVRARGQSARVGSVAMLIADELLSNAVHNAPVDASGAHHRADLPRDHDLALDDRERVTLRWGCDGRYLAIEVADLFGSLDRETILRSLIQREVRDTGGGAGMGIALTYRSCDHLVFNVAPGRRTEVIALIDVRYPQRERVAASSFNVFVERAK